MIPIFRTRRSRSERFSSAQSRFDIVDFGTHEAIPRTRTFRKLTLPQSVQLQALRDQVCRPRLRMFSGRLPVIDRRIRRRTSRSLPKLRVNPILEGCPAAYLQRSALGAGNQPRRQSEQRRSMYRVWVARFRRSWRGLSITLNIRKATTLAVPSKNWAKCGQRYRDPLFPNPPEPLVLESNSPVISKATCTTGNTTSCASRSIGFSMKLFSLRFQQLTISGPW